LCDSHIDNGSTLDNECDRADGGFANIARASGMPSRPEKQLALGLTVTAIGSDIHASKEASSGGKMVDGGGCGRFCFQ